MKRMKVVGDTWVTTEEVVKERKTKNTIKQTVKRETCRHLILECGHTRRVSDMTTASASAKHLNCYECNES